MQKLKAFQQSIKSDIIKEHEEKESMKQEKLEENTEGKRDSEDAEEEEEEEEVDLTNWKAHRLEFEDKTRMARVTIPTFPHIRIQSLCVMCIDVSIAMKCISPHCRSHPAQDPHDDSYITVDSLGKKGQKARTKHQEHLARLGYGGGRI